MRHGIVLVVLRFLLMLSRGQGFQRPRDVVVIPVGH
jgi:hypothetical protein